MPPRLLNLNDHEKWAKRKIADTGLSIFLRRMYRVDAKLYRRLAYEFPTAQTSPGTPDYEEAYRKVYQISSGLSTEQSQEEEATPSSRIAEMFTVEILVPPLSFVPFSDQYHSSTDSTFAYTKDDRIFPGDFIVIEHTDPEVSSSTGEVRQHPSRRVFLVDHVEGVGVTVRMYFKLILTPFGDTPVGFDEAQTVEDNL